MDKRFSLGKAPVKWPHQPIAALCFFAALVELFLAYPVTRLSGINQTILIAFLVSYPTFIAAWFLYILTTRPHHLYPPSEWSDQEHWLSTLQSADDAAPLVVTGVKGREGEQFQFFGQPKAKDYLPEFSQERFQADKVIENFKRLTREEPADYRKFLNLGNAYRRNKDYERAIEAYDSCLELVPSNVFALNYKGLCLKRLGKTKEAVRCYLDAIAIDPTFTKPKNNLAYYYAEVGENLDLATQLVDSVLQQQPFNPNYIDTKGLVEDALGNREKAKDLFERSKRLRHEAGMPESQTVAQHLAMVAR